MFFIFLLARYGFGIVSVAGRYGILAHPILQLPLVALRGKEKKKCTISFPRILIPAPFT